MLKNVALLLAILLVGAVGHGVYGQPLTEKGHELADEEIERLRAALALSEGGYPKAALDVMGPTADDLTVPWGVRSLIGELWEKTGDFDKAARFYQSIADELGPRVAELPGNLYLRLGTVVFKIGDYQRAISSLIQALRYPGYADDGRVYEMLADSYAQTGQPDFAARAMLLRAAVDPKARTEHTNASSYSRTSPSAPSVT
jgi:tetratricopeptide (TPR) repeat protein